MAEGAEVAAVTAEGEEFASSVSDSPRPTLDHENCDIAAATVAMIWRQHMSLMEPQTKSLLT